MLDVLNSDEIKNSPRQVLKEKRIKYLLTFAVKEKYLKVLNSNFILKHFFLKAKPLSVYI